MEQGGNKKGMVVIVSGPSGVGKSTICKEVAKQLKDVYVSVSVTTRPKGENEIDGQDRWENILELRTVAQDYNDMKPSEGLATFLEAVTLVSDVDGFTRKFRRLP